jgi:ATP synthase protein I
VVGGQLSAVSKILGYQILTIILATACFAVAGGSSKAISSSLGGLAAFIPNLYFALRMYKAKGQEPRKIVRSFYAGESGKLLLTAALFVMIFQVPNLQILPLLVEYIAVLSVFWFALLMR